jgi:protein SCO1
VIDEDHLDESGTAAPNRRRWPLVVGVIGVVIAASILLFSWLRPHTYTGFVLQSPTPAPSMTGLFDHTGAPVDLEAYRGDVVLVYFGYTHCPDVCPTTLATAAKAIEQLGRRGERVHLLMVTVDPERDTAAYLADYVTFFDARFLGVWGDPDDIAATATLYSVYYQKGEGTVETGYVVDHTATLMAIDPDGFIRVLYTPEHTADQLAVDLEELLS